MQKREFGWLAGVCWFGDQGCSNQLVSCLGGVLVMPSHQMPPSAVNATFVKMLLPVLMVSIAFGLVCQFVPGATPKNPVSGFVARSCPVLSKFSQAMSSPRVSTFQPGSFGCSIARLVLPQAEGKAAAM